MGEKKRVHAMAHNTSLDLAQLPQQVYTQLQQNKAIETG